MAVLGKWTGGTVSTLPTTTWAVPSVNIFSTQVRNDSAVYGLSSHVLSLPSTGLADGYLVIGSFEIEDTSNGRCNPSARFVYSGSGNAVSNSSSGYNRDDSEDRSYVRCWAFVDSPSALDTLTFQWKIDTDAATGGTVRSELQVMPFYYSDIGVYSSTETDCLGGTTPNQVTGFTGTDGTNITIASNTITVTGDNKKYLCLGGYYWEAMSGNQRTQRWGGFRIGGVKYDGAKGYSYARNTANDHIGELFTHQLKTTTASETIDMFVYRGDGVLNGQGGADVDGSVLGSNPNHVMVVIELHDTAEGFGSESDTTTGDLTSTTGTAMPVTEQSNFIDSASFEISVDTSVDVKKTGDYLFGADISMASNNVANTGRHTIMSEFTKNGTPNTDSVSGDYLRNNQGTIDTFGISTNQLGFETLVVNDDVGVQTKTLTGSESSGDPIANSGWVGFWGLNLDTLEDATSTVLVVQDSIHLHTSDNVVLSIPTGLTNLYTENDAAQDTDGSESNSVGSGWYNGNPTDTEITSEGAIQFAGTYCLKINALAASWSSIALEVDGVTAGNTYTWKFRVKRIGNGQIRFYTAPSNIDDNSSWTTEYTEHTQVIEIPSGDTSASIGVYPTSNSNIGDHFLLDDIRLYEGDQSSTSIELAVDDSEHAHTSENVVIISKYSLTVADASHSQIVDNVDLSPSYILGVNDSVHIQTVDNIDVNVSYIVIINDSTHNHIVENVTLSSGINLTVADSRHNHLVDGAALISDYIIITNRGNHSHLVDNITLDAGFNLLVNNALHIHDSDNAILSSKYTLLLDGNLHSHASDNVNLSSYIDLIIQGSIHSHSSGSVIVLSKYNLEVSSTNHEHKAYNVTLTMQNALTVADAVHEHLVDTVIWWDLANNENLVIDSNVQLELLLTSSVHYELEFRSFVYKDLSLDSNIQYLLDTESEIEKIINIKSYIK